MREEVENSLLMWANGSQLAGDSVSEAVICGKPGTCSDLLQEIPSARKQVMNSQPAERDLINPTRQGTSIVR